MFPSLPTEILSSLNDDTYRGAALVNACETGPAWSALRLRRATRFVR